jgi:alkylhydroperoxidase family enzyme
MIRRIIEGRIAAAEKQLGAPADYMRYMLQASLGAFLKFARFTSLAGYRRAAPRDAMHVARLVATQSQDCGTCVQIEVNLAKKDRVPSEVLRAVLDGRPDQLSDELADVYHFAMAVVERSGAEGPYRDRVRERYGDAALVELAMAIAFTQVFPITKRALGFATSCSAVKLQV